jgi:5-methylcytosine-specific restriction endonuclease McrA
MPTKPPTHRSRFQAPPASSDQERGTAHERGYGSDWRRFRLAVLQANPICCFHNHPLHRRECGIVASVVDHIQPLNQGGERLAWENVRAVCRVAHDRITQNLKDTGKNELPAPKLAAGFWG